METKNCLYCQQPFEPEHGNDCYCSAECYALAKAKRQKSIRDPVKELIRIILQNHRIISKLFTEGITVLGFRDVERYGIDISVCQQLIFQEEGSVSLAYSFGEFLLIPDSNFQTYKIEKNEKFIATSTN